MANVVIRPATAADIAAVYGETPKRTMRALAAELDGKTFGVAGVYYYPDQVVAFSNCLPEYKHLTWAIAKGTLKVLAMFKKLNIPVLAIADKTIPGSDKFLMRCGFEFLRTTSQGDVYKWHQHQ